LPKAQPRVQCEGPTVSILIQDVHTFLRIFVIYTEDCGRAFFLFVYL